MHTSTLIVGQGLCGTWLSYWLQQDNAPCLVLDDNRPNAATKAASGIINPVTGRRMAKTWLADELLPFAQRAYTALGDMIGLPLIQACPILDFFSAPDRRLDFEKRAGQFEEYLQWPANEHDWAHCFNYPFGYGIVSPACQVAVQAMLQGWRSYLQKNNCLLEESFQPGALQVGKEGISYNGISADRIVFCDGAAAMAQPYFSALPFAVNKGEALIVSIPDLPADKVYKKTLTICPWRDGLFWIGSTYDREYTDDQPTVAFRQMAEKWLQQFVKIPFSIEGHLAALRPTTVDRRPFVGMHPSYGNVGIFNGMGTKGVSLAPWFGRQMAQHLLVKAPLMPDVDVAKRFARILAR